MWKQKEWCVHNVDIEEDCKYCDFEMAMLDKELVEKDPLFNTR